MCTQDTGSGVPEASVSPQLHVHFQSKSILCVKTWQDRGPPGKEPRRHQAPRSEDALEDRAEPGTRVVLASGHEDTSHKTARGTFTGP